MRLPDEFLRAREEELNAQIPPAHRARQALHEKIQQARAQRSLTLASVFIGTAALLFQTAVNAAGPKPKSLITPGEARAITVGEVCRTPRAEVVSAISRETQQKVFSAYGIDARRATEFEVDYLITPDLGGTESVRNLWPQPYSARWNARVKDRLEQRLHELVCGGRIELATAQREIASDWITAYRRYVGEN